MTRQLPRTNSDEHEFIQFRGRQTSVSIDEAGVRFGTDVEGGRVVHRPLPVVDADADPSDVPDDAIVRPLAEQLVEQVPLVCWGVACETATEDGVCGDVFPTPEAVKGHQQAHTEPESGDDDA